MLPRNSFARLGEMYNWNQVHIATMAPQARTTCVRL